MDNYNVTDSDSLTFSFNGILESANEEVSSERVLFGLIENKVRTVGKPKEKSVLFLTFMKSTAEELVIL